MTTSYVFEKSETPSLKYAFNVTFSPCGQIIGISKVSVPETEISCDERIVPFSEMMNSVSEISKSPVDVTDMLTIASLPSTGFFGLGKSANSCNNHNFLVDTPSRLPNFVPLASPLLKLKDEWLDLFVPPN